MGYGFYCTWSPLIKRPPLSVTTRHPDSVRSIYRLATIASSICLIPPAKASLRLSSSTFCLHRISVLSHTKSVSIFFSNPFKYGSNHSVHECRHSARVSF